MVAQSVTIMDLLASHGSIIFVFIIIKTILCSNLNYRRDILEKLNLK